MARFVFGVAGYFQTTSHGSTRGHITGHWASSLCDSITEWYNMLCSRKVNHWLGNKQWQPKARSV